ncbi:MAG: VacJ family lipoprotein [Holosporaceae bacterium]|jgi:phospholipid-binding lipoprotein MlaA|nr:VacJ family lipoprotein [Holosporaceae bacterium]
MEKRFTFLLLLLLLLVSCASDPHHDDSLEEYNRGALELNLAVDRNILRPVALTYKELLNAEVRYSVANMLSNLNEPFYGVNYVLSFEAENATNSLFRFFINSTIGILGIFDVAGTIGLPKKEVSFKDTLRKKEISTGNYLVLPILGSSSTRDAIGEPVAWMINPVGYFICFPYMLAKTILQEVSNRAENSEIIDSIIKDSMDLYSTTKNIYLQKYSVKNKNEAEFSDTPNPDS